MKTGNLTIVVLAVVLFLALPLSAAISDHFNNGALDSAWQISTVNLASCTYNEAGTMLAVTDMSKVNNLSGGELHLRQSFMAAGDFDIKLGMSWDSASSYSAMQTLGVRAFSGNKIVTEGGYTDWWVGHNGQKFARVAYPTYSLDSGEDTVASSGSAVITLRRDNGVVTVWWDNNIILAGYSTLAVDTLEIIFGKDIYSGATFGTLSVDYVTAVPEPTTMALLMTGLLAIRRNKK
jgi:hypothetical protein